jgi:hypothetical protein
MSFGARLNGQPAQKAPVAGKLSWQISGSSRPWGDISLRSQRCLALDLPAGLRSWERWRAPTPAV